MFWAETRYLREEVKRLRAENRELLITVLEASGRREAANMMRSNDNVPQVESSKPKKPAKEFMGIGWRGIQKHLMSMTRPDVTSKDSIEQLEKQVEAQSAK